MAELFARLGHAPERGRWRQCHRLSRSGLRLSSQARCEKAFRAKAGRQARGQFRAASGAPGGWLILVHVIVPTLLNQNRQKVTPEPAHFTLPDSERRFSIGFPRHRGGEAGSKSALRTVGILGGA